MLITESIATHERNEIIDITPIVRRALRNAAIQEGLCVVYIPHTTAGVSINENADPDVKHDVTEKLAALIPHREAYYQHGEGNSDSHLKTMLVGPSVSLIVTGGTLLLGQWQGIYFCEFDGPRRRTVQIKLMADR